MVQTLGSSLFSWSYQELLLWNCGISRLVGSQSWSTEERFQENLDCSYCEIKTEANVDEKASALIVATDYSGKFLNTSTHVINNAWIIDFGATDHMTFDSRQVSPLRPFSQKIVSIANGNTTPVIGERSLTLTDILNLDYVLVVSSLDYNLLSVSQITAALYCIVVFWPEFCVFKDIQTR